MEEFLGRFYENRISFIIPLVEFTEQGLEDFRGLWRDQVEEMFPRLVRALLVIVRTFRPIAEW